MFKCKSNRICMPLNIKLAYHFTSIVLKTYQINKHILHKIEGKQISRLNDKYEVKMRIVSFYFILFVYIFLALRQVNWKHLMW